MVPRFEDSQHTNGFLSRLSLPPSSISQMLQAPNPLQAHFETHIAAPPLLHSTVMDAGVLEVHYLDLGYDKHSLYGNSLEMKDLSAPQFS